MGYAYTVSDSVTVGAATYTAGRSGTTDNKIESSPTIAAAKTGVLTTRTDANTGTLTMTSGHGIVTSDLVDVYWDGGRRLNMTVGTVSVDSVPIDGGSGDDLPAATTALTVCVQHVENATVVGDDVKLIIIDSPVAASVTLAQAGGTVIAAIELDSVNSNGRYVYRWDTGSGVTNPVAGATVGKIRSTHGDSTSSRDVMTYIGYN